ncbi:MAG: hypothetical protein PHT07_12325 [Paludibacter sp.]|nr:hypothetical protein [Paludibacter sp.]
MNSTNKKYDLHTEGSLYYLVREAKAGTINPPLLILMHGVGSNEQDMFSFSEHLPDNFLILSARGPLTIGPNSYAWFQVDFSTGVPVIHKEQAENSRKIIIQFLESLKTHHSFDEKQVYLGGFSQGGIMSFSVGLTRPDLIKGIAVMSGRLLNEIKPFIVPSEKLSSLKVFISHGLSDNVLNIEYARESNAYLKTLGLTPTYKEFLGGHTLPNEIWLDLISWLKSE